MADRFTVAFRAAGAAGGIAGWTASPHLREEIGQSNLARLQLGLVGAGGAAAAVELTHHGISGFARRGWEVLGDETIREGWHRLGIGYRTRNVCLLAMAACMVGSVGIGFGSAREVR